MVKCNLTPEEQAEALREFLPYPTEREMERGRRTFERFLFYDTWGRRNFREYFCPDCGRFEMERPMTDVYVEDPFLFHHGDRANCPLCGEEGTLVCLGRMKNMSSLKRWGKLAFLRNEGGRLFISAGYASMEYSFDDLRPEPEYFETTRYVVEPGKRQMWRRTTEYMGCGLWKPVGWEPKKSFAEPFARTHYEGSMLKTGEVYIVGAENIHETSMKYSQLWDYVWEEWACDLNEDDGELCPPLRGVIRYLGEYSKHPQIEMLVKLGHRDVVTRLLEAGTIDRRLVDWRAKSPAAFFRMDKHDYSLFRDGQGSLAMLGWFRKYREEGMTLSFEEYLGFSRWLAGGIGEFLTICERYSLDQRQAMNYLQEQAPEGANGKYTLGIWKDFLSMGVQLGQNMTFRRNIYPEKLHQEHDAVAKQVNAMKIKEEKKSYGKRFLRLKKMYAYSDGELSIVVPVNGEEITREGKTLQHCVGGYAKRHLEGKTTILFLRKKENPHEPYVTIEIRDADHHIVQVHGYRNELDGAQAPRIRHAAFFDEWERWLLQGSPRTKNGRPIRPRKKTEEKAV